ncbi:MAG: fasciclin domain-containing protein [Bacteroidales bacterium]
MKKSIKLILVAIFAVGMFGMTGCEDHQERYETPPWLGGSSIETLEERGNYTTFLALMEKANYTEPISKQLFTLFVPDDAAFDAYFKSIGKNSVNDLTKDEAVSLFTLHVLRNPRSRFNMVYEFAWNEFQGPYQDIKMGEYASLFHRKETPSTSIPYSEVVKYSPPQMVGQELLIYTGTKNVPLFTEEFFTDYGGDINGSDYVFMYPGSTWKKDYTPNLKGMNWHNAQVIPNPEIPDELEVRTASGFIYFIDRVVPIMPSIEEHMRNNLDKYSVYYDILQRFAQYGNTKVDEQQRVLYRKSYEQLFDLAHERGPSAANDGVIPPQNMWTAFIPTNDVLQNYLDNTVLKYYPSLDSVPKVTLYYILQTQLSRTLVIMSKLQKGYFNAFGDAMDIPKSDITSGYMCSNGVVYESKKVLEPNVFTCVPGLLFIDKDYSTLLYVLNKTNMLSVLSNPDSHVTLFASTNADLEAYGIRYNATNGIVEFRSPADGKWNTMNTTDLNFFAQDQIFKGRLSDFSGEGGYVEMYSGNYINYTNNQVAAGENQSEGNLAGVVDVIENERNGFLVKVDKPVQSRFVMGQYLKSDPDVSEFSALLTKANLLDLRYRDPVTKEVIPNLKFLAGAKYWTGFIPTNEAMQKAREEGIIPEKFPTSTTGKDSINSFIMYHFVKDDVVFDDGKSQKGIYKTNRTYKDDDGKTTLNATVSISNIPKNLSITDVSEQVVYLDHAKANILVRKGVCHKIDTVLKYYK